MTYLYNKVLFTNGNGKVFRTKAPYTASNEPQYWTVGIGRMFSQNGLYWNGNYNMLLRHTSIIGGVTAERCCLVWEDETKEWFLLSENSPIAQAAIAASSSQAKFRDRDVKPGSTVIVNGKSVHYYGKKSILTLPRSRSEDDKLVVKKKHVCSRWENDISLTTSLKVTSIEEEGGALLSDGVYVDKNCHVIIVADEIKRFWFATEAVSEWSSFSRYGEDVYASTRLTNTMKGQLFVRKRTTNPVYRLSLDGQLSFKIQSGSMPVDEYVKLILFVETNNGTIRHEIPG